MSKQQVDVSIIIRAKNEEEKIGQCLASLLAQQTERQYEIIVIDSGSTDHTLDICRRHGVRIHEISSESFNYGKALNIGAALARGTYFISFTAHAKTYDQYWLETILAHFDRDPQIAGVYGRELPWPDALPIEAARLSLRFPMYERKYTLRNSAPKDYDDILRRVIYSNVASATRLEHVRQHPFPEMTYGEDKVWAQKMLTLGYDIIYDPAASVYHSHNESILDYYRRQFKSGRSKLEAEGRPPTIKKIVRLELGDQRGQMRYFRKNLPVGKQFGWIMAATMYTMIRIAAQYRGSREPRGEAEG